MSRLTMVECVGVGCVILFTLLKGDGWWAREGPTVAMIHEPKSKDTGWMTYREGGDER